MRYILTLAAIFMTLPLLAIGTPAAANCTDKDVRAVGDIGGGPFNVPADTRSLTGPSDEFVKLTAEDCDTDTDTTIDQSEAIQKARRDGRRAASIAASMDAYGWGEGLNVTLNGANSGVGNDDTYAAGLVLGYKHTFANPGVVHSIAGKIGGAADTTGSDYGASVGVTINFGTF